MQAHQKQHPVSQLGATQELMETWKEPALLQQTGVQQLPTHTMTQSLSGSSQFVTGHHQTGQQLATTSKMVPAPSPQVMSRPLTQLSSTLAQGGLPETIQEMPSHQEDDTKIEDKSQRALPKQEVIISKRGRQQEEDFGDFNSRESSISPTGGEGKRKLASALIRQEDGNDGTHILIKQESSTLHLTRPLPLVNQPSNQPNPMMTVDSQNLTLQANLAQIDQILQGGAAEPTPKGKKVFTGAIPMSLQTLQAEKNPVIQSSDMKHILSPSSSSLQKTHQKTGERFHNNAAATGSSFYNATMHLQKQQEQNQQEELQKQLMRIYGSATPIVEEAKPAIQQPVLNAKLSSTRAQSAKSMSQKQKQEELLRKQQEEYEQKVQEQQQEYLKLQQQRMQYAYQQQQMYQQAMIHQTQNHHNREEDLMLQTNINIADSMNEETAQKQLEQYHNHHQQYYSEVPTYKMPADEDPQEVVMNEKPKIHYQFQELANKFQQSETQLDIWNDPDLVPTEVNLEEVDEHIESYFGKHQEEGSLHPPSLLMPHHYGGGSRALSNVNTSMHGGTINQLKMLSPPSIEDQDDSHINLGTYKEEQYQAAQQEVPRPFSKGGRRAVPKANEEEVEGPLASDRSMSRKEKDIIEIAKLIQKATDTTNSLLGHTDHFKFRFKKDGEPTGPFINAKKQPAQIKQAAPVVENDRDSQIMSNIDRMLENYEIEKRQGRPQSQQQFADGDKIQIGQEEEDLDDSRFQPSVDPIAALQANEDRDVQMGGISLRKQGPPEFTGIYRQPARAPERKYEFQRPLSSTGEVPPQQMTSQRSLGKFAQMAAQNLRNDPQMIEEVSRKFGGGSNSRGRDSSSPAPHQDGGNKHQILRPVSGKSNSTRYGGRREVPPKSPVHDEKDMYFDEEDQQ